MVFRLGNHSFVLFKLLQKDSSYFSKIFLSAFRRETFFIIFFFFFAKIYSFKTKDLKTKRRPKYSVYIVVGNYSFFFLKHRGG